ncbi:hypothetical protein RAS1_33940 [Phycisphaerae bacterium RAS1]|nr:hypothetical protein RAS1_33940 [Phycisphaerae bacterium RAS1]
MNDSRFLRTPATPRAARDARRRVALACIVACWPATCFAQLRPTIIQNATILVGDGTVIEKGSVSIKGDEVFQVGEVEAGMLAKKINAEGRFVTPGLIDVWSTLGQAFDAPPGQATGRAADGFNRYDTDVIATALSGGVTTIYLPARTAREFGGVGAVVRLIPGGDELVMNNQSAVCAALGVRDEPPLTRVRAGRDFRKALSDAKDYREAKDTYQEELKEYEKKLKEQADKEKSASKPAAGPGKGPASKPADSKPETTSKPTKKKKKSPTPGGAGPGAGPGGPPGEKKDSAGESKDKKDEVKKPAEPPRDPAKETLIKVLDGDLPLRVEVHRPEDILSVLAIAKEFNVRLILEGATGAHHVADQIAKAEVPVVLGPPPPSMLYSSGSSRFASPDALSVLLKSKVKCYLGSGPSADEAAPTLSLRAARAVADGLDANLALKLLTADAAEFLKLSRKLGRVAPGLSADLVVWSAHPLSPTARVERVFIAGSEVYRDGKLKLAAADDEEED